MSARLVFHVGYPKTGTTTFQQHVFPAHPEIAYLGKRIPGYGYASAGIGHEIAALLHAGHDWNGAHLKDLIVEVRETTLAACVLVSSENFVHVDSQPPEAIAERLAGMFPDCRVLICLRRQEDLLASFWRNHGAFGSYLYVKKAEGESLTYPLSFDRWLELNFRCPFKNILGVLDYDHVIARYEALLGADAVSVLMYETLVQDMTHFCGDLAAALGVSAESMRSLAEGHWENAGLTEYAFRRLAEQASGAGAAVSGVPSAARSGEAAVEAKMSDRWAAAIAQRFAIGNTKLADRRGLALRDLGYSVV